jgi:monothiol glutaredoxin
LPAIDGRFYWRRAGGWQLICQRNFNTRHNQCMALPDFAAYIGTRDLQDEPAPAVDAAKGKTTMSIEQFIDNEVKSNDVVLFMKGTPQFPMCGFSGQVVQILDYLGVPYKGLNVLENDDLRGGIKSYSNWPTIPQLYVKGEFVGGCDIIREMFQAGELQSLFKDNGIAVKEAAQV